MFCREAACCQRVTLNKFKFSDCPSRMAKSDEEAQGLGNGYFHTSVLHLNLVWVELKCRQTFGGCFVFFFYLVGWKEDFMPICYRKSVSLGLMKQRLIYGAAHRRGQYWCSFRKQLDSDIHFPMLHRDCVVKNHRRCTATRNKVLVLTWGWDWFKLKPWDPLRWMNSSGVVQ